VPHSLLELEFSLSSESAIYRYYLTNTRYPQLGKFSSLCHNGYIPQIAFPGGFEALDNKESTNDAVRSNDEVHVRLVLAGNPHTTPAAFAKLADDPSEKVRSRLAANPRLPEDVFQKLAKDESVEVRESLCENPNAPDAILEQLAKDESEDVRLAIAAVSTIPLHLLKGLAEDDNMYVAGAAKKTLEEIEAKSDTK
jgi:hypothetical protein